MRSVRGDSWLKQANGCSGIDVSDRDGYLRDTYKILKVCLKIVKENAMLKKYLIVFLVSMVPLIELRGAIPISQGMGLPIWTSYVVSIIGNMVPVPFIYLFARKILEWGADKPVIGKFFTFCLEKGKKGGEKLQEKAGRGLFVALMLFVGIPLPGTGAWTGTLAASLLDMKFKDSVIAVMLGVLLAGIIMMAASMGVFGAAGALLGQREGSIVMEAYTDFAEVYDTFMGDVPYEEWADFLASLIEAYGVSRPVREPGEVQELEEAPESGYIQGFEEAPESGEVQEFEEVQEEPGVTEEDALISERNLVLDLGCGTGTITELLYEKGYDMIGVDSSEEMLQIALDKKFETGSDILYLCQDMRELDLYSTVGTVVSVCDSLNYLLMDEDVLQTFHLVNNYLFPGGIFIFDFNTIYKYEEVIGDTTIAENREDCSFIWENFYSCEDHINEYDVTVFERQEDDLYRRFTETHYQRGYTLEEMKTFLEKAGLIFVTALDEKTHKAPTETSERIYVIAREHGKQ